MWVDEGMFKPGVGIQIARFEPEFREGLVCFADSDSIHPLQLADFAAFGLNRMQLILGKNQLSDIDRRFTKIYSGVAWNYLNLKKTIIGPNDEWKPIDLKQSWIEPEV